MKQFGGPVGAANQAGAGRGVGPAGKAVVSSVFVSGIEKNCGLFRAARQAGAGCGVGAAGGTAVIGAGVG